MRERHHAATPQQLLPACPSAMPPALGAARNQNHSVARRGAARRTVDDLHVAWQQLLHHCHRPLLHRLGQHGVVGEVAGLRGNGKGRLGASTPAPSSASGGATTPDLHAGAACGRAMQPCARWHACGAACAGVPPHARTLHTRSQALVQPRPSWSISRRISSGTARGWNGRGGRGMSTRQTGRVRHRLCHIAAASVGPHASAHPA